MIFQNNVELTTWWFKTVFRYSKSHTDSTLIEEDNEMQLLFPPWLLESKQMMGK